MIVQVEYKKEIKLLLKGTSMIEVLFAMVILSSVFVSLFQVLHTGFKGTERLSEESYAANHAISLLESVTALTYSDIPLIPSGTSDQELATYFASVPEFTLASQADNDFPRTIEVVEVSKRANSSGDADNSEWGALKSICVVVTWKAAYMKGDKTKSKSFHTLVTDDMEVTR